MCYFALVLVNSTTCNKLNMEIKIFTGHFKCKIDKIYRDQLYLRYHKQKREGWTRPWWSLRVNKTNTNVRYFNFLDTLLLNSSQNDQRRNNNCTIQTHLLLFLSTNEANFTFLTVVLLTVKKIYWNVKIPSYMVLFQNCSVCIHSFDPFQYKACSRQLQLLLLYQEHKITFRVYNTIVAAGEPTI